MPYCDMSVFVFTSEWLGQVPACLLGVTEMLVPVLALLCLLHFVLGVKGELFTAAAGCYAEMISKRGYDTVIVPLANAAVLLLIKI